MEWAGDAGNVASLEDMINYEKYLHRSWNDPQSIYNTIAKPQTYNDGAPAAYGFGLAHLEIDGRHAMGHGGALRGFRLGRVHVPSEKLSVVVFFNHESDSHGAVEAVVKQLIKQGADINAPGSRLYGNALQVASYWGNETIVELLIDDGADINAKDNGLFIERIHLIRGE